MDGRGRESRMYRRSSNEITALCKEEYRFRRILAERILKPNNEALMRPSAVCNIPNLILHTCNPRDFSSWQYRSYNCTQCRRVLPLRFPKIWIWWHSRREICLTHKECVQARAYSRPPLFESSPLSQQQKDGIMYSYH